VAGHAADVVVDAGGRVARSAGVGFEGGRGCDISRVAGDIVQHQILAGGIGPEFHQGHARLEHPLNGQGGRGAVGPHRVQGVVGQAQRAHLADELRPVVSGRDHEG